jgi:CheY-like chemotaxis protein
MPNGALVLVIDDDGDHLIIHATLLTHGGYSVITARTPEAGLELARMRRPGLILLDLHFGGEPRGLELLDALADDSQTADIPVIVITAFGDLYPGEIARRRARMLKKGGDPRRLLDAIGAVLPPGPIAH